LLDGRFGSSFETCWSKTKHRRELARVLVTTNYTARGDETRVHPTQKPVALAEWFFERWGDANEIVVDLYGGSGTTLIACEKTSRHCRLMELDPAYCDVICKRWADFTGQEPVLEKA
jgi:DNA modification methylase